MVETRYGTVPDEELVFERIPYYPEDPISPEMAYFVGYMCGDAGLKDIERSKKVTGYEEFKILGMKSSK